MIFAASAAAVAGMMIGLWAVSVAKRDASIVDIFWGLGFVLVAWTGFALGAGWTPRSALVSGLVTLWGVRLAGYLAWRNWGQGEDYRYQAMRRRWGDRFAWVSLVTVFGLQGLILWIVSLPVQAVAVAAEPARWTLFDGVGAALVGIGLCFESVADFQLARFKADPANRGRVMDRGLWGLSRHPNYFGDAVVWWGVYVLACATPLGPWTLPGPLLMNIFLARVSGVPMLERKLVKTRPEYAAYAARTNALVPWPPRRGSGA